MKFTGSITLHKTNFQLKHNKSKCQRIRRGTPGFLKYIYWSKGLHHSNSMYRGQGMYCFTSFCGIAPPFSLWILPFCSGAHTYGFSFMTRWRPLFKISQTFLKSKQLAPFLVFRSISPENSFSAFLVSHQVINHRFWGQIIEILAQKP